MLIDECDVGKSDKTCSFLGVRGDCWKMVGPDTAWLLCEDCGKRYPADKAVYKCQSCSGRLEIEYDYSKIRNVVNRGLFRDRTQRDMWRYRELLPVDPRSMVSLGEGGTPLIETDRLARKLGMSRLLLKLEYACPTGSFKDRGSSLLLSKAREVGANTVAIDSSGNAAASLAAYSARAGVSCYVFTPSYASAGKLIQAIAYRAKVVKVDGTRRETFEIAKTAIEKYGWYYCGFQVNPFASEGSKTIGYEICEQSRWETPDVLVFPVGSGSGLVGCWKGLKEAKELGLVERLPSMVCVQPEGCSPISSAFNENREIIAVERPKTIAEGLMIAQPLKGGSVLRALEESRGFAEAPSDEEIMDAAKLLAEFEGIFVEPSAAASVAGMIKLIDVGKLHRDQSIVCVLTGIGLKTSEAYSNAFSEPITIKPKMEEIEKIPVAG